MCMLCPKNQIKSNSGDTSNCTSCDGESNVPNSGHTACGESQMSFIFKIFVFFSAKNVTVL